MKKTLYPLLLAVLALGVSSCTRSEVDDPAWDDPAGFHILLEGSAAPAVMVIDGYIHTSQIYVKVTDSAGRPLANRSVFFEQLPDPADEQVSWGYFPNNASTYQRNTDANGEIRLTFYWPLQFYSEEMWIHAVLMIDDRAIKESESGVIGNIPQDFISLTMYRSGT